MKYSIIIVGYKATDPLNRCLRSLVANPPAPGRTSKADAEIILIDNSPEPIEKEIGNDFLVKLLQTYTSFTVEWHPENLGFAAGCNRGVELSSGEYVVLVNPDTEVFPEWSERMVAHMAPDVGAVGPISNFVAGWQRADMHMRMVDDPAKNAQRAIKGLNKRGVETKLLIGFFCMIRRSAWDKVGGMDPQFFLGCDDLDLSMRLREAGYALIIASDVFVYHEGHKSFEAAGMRSLELNRQSEKRMLAKLREKYCGGLPGSDKVVECDLPTSTQLWGCEILPTHIPKPMTLSVCMIVRDEEENLRELLPQLDFADEIIIVDTSEMLTPFRDYHNGQKPREFGMTWTDSFAEARNFALSKCTSDWVLWLDADDRVSPESAALIRAALDHPGPRTQAKTCHFGFMLRDHGPDGLNFAAGHPRLFPRIPGLEWEGRVHESYMPAAARLGIEKVDCDNIIIDHYGYQDPAVMLKKHERNLRLMRMEEDSPKKFYHMGKNLHGLGHFLEAEDCFRKVLDPQRWAAPLDKEFRDNVRLCMAALIIQVKGADCPDLDQYLDGNDKPDALFVRAEVALKRGQVFEAEEMYKEYAGHTQIIDPFGSQQEYLQKVARGRLETIQKVRDQVYAR